MLRVLTCTSATGVGCAALLSCWLLDKHAADLSNGFVAHLLERWRREGLSGPAAQRQGSDQLSAVLDVVAGEN